MWYINIRCYESRQAFKNLKRNFEKSFKKCLTNTEECDKISELLLRITDNTKWTLIIEQYINQPESSIKTKYSGLDEYFGEQEQNSKKETKIFSKIFANTEFAMQIHVQSQFFWQGQNFNMRVWSWLRMNAGGVPNTCKSNEA